MTPLKTFADGAADATAAKEKQAALITATRPAHVIVVGAGTAGSIVAATMSEDPMIQVTVIEAGEDRSAELPFNLFEAVGNPSAFWPDSAVMSGVHTGTYRRGRGIGGSSEINGCVASSPSPDEVDSWGTITGDHYWRWDRWQTSFAAVAAHGSAIDSARWGRADRALLGAIGHEKGARWKPARFAIDPVLGTRANYGFTHLTEARKRPNLRVETDAVVERLLVDSTQSTKQVGGVRLVGGREITADHTVVCAGAIGSPVLLLRSGVGSRATGRNLINHRGVSFTWKFPSASSPQTSAETSPQCSPQTSLQSSAASADSTPVSSIVVDIADPSDAPRPTMVQLLPLNQVGTDPASASYGGLLCCPLDAVSSRGEIQSVDSDVPTIEFPMADADRMLLVRAARIGATLANAAVANGDAEAAYADANGTPANVVAAMTDAELGAWVERFPAPMYHATGTCRMGSPEDPDAVVDPFCDVLGTTGLSVIDASAFPTLPAAGPHLTVAAFALHATRRLLSRWTTQQPGTGDRP